MNNGAGRIFGFRPLRPGATAISASAENRKADLLHQVANLHAMPPLFMRRNGNGIDIGIDIPAGDSALYACRVAKALKSGVEMGSSERATPNDPAVITYLLVADKRATGALPPGVDLSRPMVVRYGRPMGLAALVLASNPGDLALVSSTNRDPELWILGERIASRACTAPAPADPPPPGPAPDPGFAFNSALASTAGPSPESSFTPDPQMASFSAGQTEHLKADVQDDQSEVFYCGDADYVSLTGLMQAGTIKSAWLRDLLVEWSPDGRVWDFAQMVDPSAGTKSQAIISADGFITIDVRGGIAYVRAKWNTGGTLAAADTKLEIKFTKKRGTR